MKKKSDIKKIWVIILGIMAILLMAGVTLAIYTSQVYQRAVVRNRYNDVIRFSSDKLYRVTDKNNPKDYYYPMGENQTTMTFSVCNYDQANNTLFNEKDIKYDISFTVTDGTDNFNYIVSCGNNRRILQNNGSGSMESVLKGGKRSVDTYTITFSESDYKNVKIKVIVTPDDSSITQKTSLNGILIPIEYATTQGVKLSHEFIDEGRGDLNEFDAYNLLVSVSGGEGNVLITWNHTKLDIDPFFSDGKPINKNGDKSIITVSMNSEDATGTYLITFYNHNNTKLGWKEWKELPITVKLEESTSENITP